MTSSHLPHRAQAKSAAEAPGGGRRVEELEQLVDEVQATEREAWRWLDEALTSGGGRARDLQQYISRGDVTDDDVIDDVTEDDVDRAAAAAAAMTSPMTSP